MSLEFDLLPEDLKEKLGKALASGQYFVTLTYLDDSANLQHFYVSKKFFNNDYKSSLEKIKEMIQKDNENIKWQ